MHIPLYVPSTIDSISWLPTFIRWNYSSLYPALHLFPLSTSSFCQTYNYFYIVKIDNIYIFSCNYDHISHALQVDSKSWQPINSYIIVILQI